MRTEYYVRAQERKTIKYKGKQHLERSMTIPAELSRIWDLKAGQTVRLKWDGNGNVVLTKVSQRPARARLTYVEWVERLSPFIPEKEPGKTYQEICKQAGISHGSAPAIWVRQAEKDLGLVRTKDSKTHRTLWSLDPQKAKPASIKPASKDMKLTDIMSQLK